MINRERVKIIESVLEKKGAMDTCISCGEEIFAFFEGKLFLDLSPDKKVTTIAVIVKICDNCGHASQYGIDFLGILPEEIKNDK